MTLPFGSDDTLADRLYYEPDPLRHNVPEEEFAKALEDWRGTLAALDGEAGLSIYRRASLDDEAYVGDWERWEPEDVDAYDRA